MATKIELLRRVPLFSGCSGRQVSKIAARTEEHEVREGFVLAREGGPGHTFFIVVEGEADVTLRGRRLRRIGPGDCFGEMALIDRGPRAATVTAVTSMRLYALEAKAFTSVLRSTPAVAERILATLSTRLREEMDAPRSRANRENALLW